MTGKAGYRPTPGYEDRPHFIGPVGNPVWVGKKGDVPRLFTDKFWEVYRAWNSFHLGLTKPDVDSSVADGVAALEGQYRAHFDDRRAIIERLDVILRVLTGGGKRPAGR